MQQRWMIAAALLTMCGAAMAAAPTAAPVPASVTAAVSDKARPAEDVARDAERKPAQMVVFAGIKPGDVVVDAMPGKGYFTRIFAKAVGSKGHVYA